jgi:hypothetical protein
MVAPGCDGPPSQPLVPGVLALLVKPGLAAGAAKKGRDQKNGPLTKNVIKTEDFDI